ncbi:DUF4259 domain-containing protein [Oerskovia sp. NPDC057915]|uniref:DUF4259 domain-containing protein n=1 Tax=Oerskovia sp. NPDC057915 TaxID=3346280 RepID=UPI0036DD527C
MGTWGSGPFENDGAGDLLSALRAGSFGIEDFSGYLDEDYLEVDDAQAAIAIAEVIAVARGLRPADAHLEGVDAVAFAASLTDQQRAWVLTTLERAVEGSDTSELHELWAENGPEGLAEWRDPVVSRLASLRPPG